MIRSKFRTDAKESDIQKLILDWLAAEKIWHMRLNTGSFAMAANGNQKRRFFRAGKPGMADILTVKTGHGFNMIFTNGALPGGNGGFTQANGCTVQSKTIVTAMVWIEVKARKGIQSPDQKAFQAEIEAQGMKYILARSLDEVIEGMR